MAKIGLIGCGVMGKGLASRFLQAGHTLVIARNPASSTTLDSFLKDQTIQELVEKGARIAQDFDDVFSECEILALCLPDHRAVESVLLDAGGLEGSPSPAVRLVIDFTSSKPETTKKIASRLIKKQIDLLDAPMGGGPLQAAEGALTIAVGGKEVIFQENRELLSCVASKLVYAGPCGCGHALKLLNNALAILNWTATSAAYLLCDCVGANREALFALVSGSGANSTGFQTQSLKIQQNLYPRLFDLHYAEKDIRYAVEMMAESPLSYPPFFDAAQLMKNAEEAGYGKQDVGTIYKYMEGKMKETATD